MTIDTITTNGGQPIECFYDASLDKDYFDLTLPTTDGCLVTVKVHRLNTIDLIDTLKRHDERMRIATGGVR